MEPINSQEGDDNEQQQVDQEGELVTQNGLQENKTASSSNHTNTNTTPSYMGKHRLNAALTQLNHQIQIIQEELDMLETLGQSSLVCRDLVTTVESIPDALLPEIRGPPIVGWDRWFQGGSRARKRWI